MKASPSPPEVGDCAKRISAVAIVSALQSPYPTGVAQRSEGIPAGFIEMNPELREKALKKYESCLDGENKKLEALYRQHKYCPEGCGPTMEKTAGPNVEWAFQDSLVPRSLMKCHICGCTINPHDGMVVRLGDEAAVAAAATGARIINVDED